MEELKRSQNEQKLEKARQKDAELTLAVLKFNICTHAKDWSRCVNTLEWYLVQLQDLKTDSTPLHTAAKQGYRAILEVLLKHKLKVDLRVDAFNNTMLHIAAEYNQISVVSPLLENGADFKVTDSNDGDTVFFWAAKNGNLDVVKLLVRHGAKVNALNKKGCSALHYCASNGDLPLVQFLIEHGARNIPGIITDDSGGIHYNVLPLNLAIQKKQSALVNYLSKLNNF